MHASAWDWACHDGMGAIDREPADILPGHVLSFLLQRPVSQSSSGAIAPASVTGTTLVPSVTAMGPDPTVFPSLSRSAAALHGTGHPVEGKGPARRPWTQSGTENAAAQQQRHRFVGIYSHRPATSSNGIGGSTQAAGKQQCGRTSLEQLYSRPPSRMGDSGGNSPKGQGDLEASTGLLSPSSSSSSESAPRPPGGMMNHRDKPHVGGAKGASGEPATATAAAARIGESRGAWAGVGRPPPWAIQLMDRLAYLEELQALPRPHQHHEPHPTAASRSGAAGAASSSSPAADAMAAADVVVTARRQQTLEARVAQLENQCR